LLASRSPKVVLFLPPEEFVDVVVRHQGDLTLVEILQRIEAGRPLDLVQGCWFKRGSQII
jgi:anaerobic magnesium-protoporphyrin IX monomethyl ester cyclase